jgi:hypothetical protein
MTRLARAALAVAFLFLAAGARAADPVAFVSDITGNVVLDGGGRPRFLADLLPGSKLVLAPQASATVMFVVSGAEFILRGPGEFLVAKQGIRVVKGATPSSRVPPQRVSTAVLVDTSKAATASLRMRSAAPARAEPRGPLYPVSARIATLQPTLRWAGEPETTYSVVVTATGGSEVFRGNAKGPMLRLPVRLAAGQGYAWKYSAGEQVLGDARFETLPAEAVQAADKSRAAAKSFADRVLLALALQDLGAAQDAREVWAQLASERPDIPELAGLAR